VTRILSRTVRWVAIAAATLYGMGIIVLAALWSFAANPHWSIAFSNIFAAGFFLPLLLFVPAALVLRSRWVYMVTALPLVVFLALFGPRFIPRAGLAAAVGTPLRVVTFNQLFRNTNTDRLIAAIRSEHADVVAVQELVPAVAEAMQLTLKTTYPHQILSPANNVGGLGLLSRYPLDPAAAVDGAPGQWATVHISGQTITLVNVHVHFSGVSRIRPASAGPPNAYGRASLTARVRAARPPAPRCPRRAR